MRYSWIVSFFLFLLNQHVYFNVFPATTSLFLLWDRVTVILCFKYRPRFYISSALFISAWLPCLVFIYFWFCFYIVYRIYVKQHLILLHVPVQTEQWQSSSESWINTLISFKIFLMVLFTWICSSVTVWVRAAESSLRSQICIFSMFCRVWKRLEKPIFSAWSCFPEVTPVEKG